MTQQLDLATLATILQARDVEDISATDLVRLFREEAAMSGFLPDGLYQVDPRNGDRILYNSSRSRRPHDNRPPSTTPAKAPDCVICQGRTTGVVDVADLSEGFTFINKNLFPALYPLEGHPLAGGQEGDPTFGPAAYGFHFLQWTSSLHDRDWHNMPLADLTVVISRLAALEKSLLAASGDLLPGAGPDGRGFVSMVKNYGRLVGGSLAHGHQQIAFSNVMPRRVWDNRRFEAERGQTFSAYLLHRNPAGLTIADYGPAALLVPYFMRRPYDMILLVRDTGKGHLSELTADEVAAVARGWHDATRAFHTLMPAIGREVAYNVITNNGPGTGLYFEFLPYTQEDGGLEKLGLFVCQGKPEMAAARLREILGEP